LNLTLRSMAAVLKYDRKIPRTNEETKRKGYRRPVKGYYASESTIVELIKKEVAPGYEGESFKTLECSIMDLADDMPATVAKEMPSASEIAAFKWLPDHELAVYAAEYQRNGFQGGLNWYRSRTGGAFDNELQLFSGRTIDVPSIFISGKSDWGVYQQPGALERMQETVCTRMVGVHLLDGAGHWVQQEQPEEVSSLLIDFLRGPAVG